MQQKLTPKNQNKQGTQGLNAKGSRFTVLGQTNENGELETDPKPQEDHEEAEMDTKSYEEPSRVRGEGSRTLGVNKRRKT